MYKSIVGSRFTVIALLALAAFGERPAAASGFLAARFGGEHGSVVGDDPTTIYYNPAGLSLVRGRLRIYLNGVFAWRSASYDRPKGAIDRVLDQGMAGTGTPADAVDANAAKGTLLNFITSPFISVSTDFGSEWVGAGVAFYAPFGGQAVWKQNEKYRDSMQYPGAIDGPQRWATIDGTIRSLYITAAGSFRVPKWRLSLGLGLNVVINEVSTLRARTALGTDDLVTSSGAVLEGRSFIDVRNVTASLGAGIMWQPADNWWLGASYQSQPGFGENTLSGTLQNKLGSAAAAKQDVELKQSLPDVVRFGFRVRPVKKLELRLFGEYVRWSVFQRQCILDKSDAKRSCKLKPDGSQNSDAGGSGIILNLDRQWKDAGGVRAGASYWVSDAVELYLGAGYDSNAIPNSTLEPALMDMEKITLALGGRFEMLKKRLAIDLSYTQVVYFERTIAVRGRDDMGKPISPAPPSKSPDAAGTYNQAIGLVSLALEYRFW